MLRRIWGTFILLIVGSAGALWADEPAYATRVATQANGQSVLVTWKDAVGYPGAKYEIFRSDKEITKDNLSKAKLLATVETGIEAYEDKNATAPSYYLILLKDKSGNERKFFVPFKNKTTAPVQPTGEPPAPTAQIQVGDVAYASPQVQIAFQASPPDKKLLVFRRTSPIRSAADLKDSSQLGSTTGSGASFRDTPPPGLQFYYAIVDAQAYADGRPDTFAPTNATVQSAGFPLVELPQSVLDATPDPSLRPKVTERPRDLPLPLLQIAAEPDSGTPLVPTAYRPVAAQPLPQGAQTALGKVARTAPVTPLPFPPLWIFPEERSGSQEGAGRYLAEIRQAYLQPGDWKGARAALANVLRLSLDAKTEARARFYLAESWGAQGEYRQAFVEFLSARDVYPDETEPYLEALFSLLAAAKD